MTIEGSTLQVPEGATLSVVGGDLAITGQGALTAASVPTLGAPGGRITLASVAAAGEVPVNVQEFTGETVARLGRVALVHGALLDASGAGGGTVVIRGGRLLVDQSFVFADTHGARDGVRLGVDINMTGEVAITHASGITTDALGAGRAGDIRIRSGSLEASDAAFIASRPFPATTGDGGDIMVEVERLTLRNGAQIRTSTAGMGRGGSVTVTASDAVALADSAIFADTQGTDARAGAAGNIMVMAPRVTLTDGALIGSLTRGPGPGGTVTMTATDTIMITGQSSLISATTDVGDAGQLTLKAPTVHLADGGLLGAPSLSFAGGRAGDLVLEVGTLTLTGGAQITNTSLGSGRGGRVSLTATETLTITGQDQAGVPSGLSFDTFGVGDAGFISIFAPILFMDGGAITVGTSGIGNAGNIFVGAETMTLTGGAQIVGRSRGTGSGGTVSLAARETLTITGQDQAGVPSGLSFDTSGLGDAGRITIAAPTLRVEGGTITASTSGPRDAGRIDLLAIRMTLTGGAQIVGRSSGSGRGGTVNLAATEALTISGQDQACGRSGLSFDTSSLGNAGTIRITAPTLQVEGGTITANTTGAGAGGTLIVEVGTLTLTGGAQLSSSTAGVGRGGTIAVQGLKGVGSLADVVTLAGQGSGLFTSAEGSGPGGNITLQARTIELTQGARIAAASTGTGNAGGITLTVGDTLLLRGHSAVTTEASEATGGNIRVTASARVRLQDSQISATVSGGAGDGGNVTIDPAFILLQGSQITANAVTGNGGRIDLTASQALLMDPSSAVTASSTRGLKGQVNIQAPVTSISGAVAPLPQAFAQTGELLQSRCAERLREGTVSRFIVGGRDGVPLEPGSLLLSPLERVGRAAGVQGDERESHNPEAQHGRAWYAQAQAFGNVAGECARWRGKPGTTPGAPRRWR
jgi:large exoprotein involved in heme utilization and adhesion